LKRIVFSEEAKADIRAVPPHIAMNILTAIHRLAESGAGRVKTAHSWASSGMIRSMKSLGLMIFVVLWSLLKSLVLPVIK
jgi:hypothetical protein